MIYKALNRLFGWDFILWSNSADRGVSRVFTLPGGEACYWRYKSIKCLDLIFDAKDVVWLTCKPEKYLAINGPEKTHAKDQNDC